MNSDYNVDEACLVLMLGLMCSQPFPYARPIMRQVMQYLDGDMPLPELTPTNFSFSSAAFMQNEEFDMYPVEYPWSGINVGSRAHGISDGR